MQLGAWAALVYFGVALSAVVFVLWIRGVAVVPASTAAVFTGVLPISAVALSYLFLREPFAWSHPVGLACVLLGIWLVTGRTGDQPPARSDEALPPHLPAPSPTRGEGESSPE